MPAKMLLISLAAVSALALTTAAHAAPATGSSPEAATMKVSLADLNLGSDTGAAAGLRRIENPSKVVCGGEPNLREYQRHVDYAACVAVTVDRAVTSLANPRVTALHRGAGRSIILVSR